MLVVMFTFISYLFQPYSLCGITRWHYFLQAAFVIMSTMKAHVFVLMTCIETREPEFGEIATETCLIRWNVKKLRSRCLSFMGAGDPATSFVRKEV